MMKARCFILMFMLLQGLYSCSSNVFSALEDVESYIQERPDSALAVLRAIDRNTLESKKSKAKFSLLYAMALDKNYIDTTDVSVIMPAVEYYQKHGTSDEILKAFYYLGRLQYNDRDYNSAVVSFSKGERVCDDASDYQAKGLLYMAFADIYNNIRNKDKEAEYVKKGISAFEKAGDLRHGNLSAGRLAILYYGRQDWDKADSLFRIGIEKAREDTVAMSVFLSNYARMKVVQPNQDPVAAIELLKQLSQSYNRPLSLTDYGVWAYASALTGDMETSIRIENQLEKLNEPNRNSILYWLYRIEQYRGNYEKSLEYNIDSNSYNSEIIDQLLSDSIGQTLKNYYLSEANDLRRESHILRLRLLLVAMGLCFMFLLILACQKYKRDKREKEIDRLFKIGEETNKLLKQSNENLQEQVNLLKISGGKQEKMLENLRKEYVSTYKDKFSAIGRLCDAYINSTNRTDRKDFIVRRVENLIAYISDDDKLHSRFENQINKDLNNIVKRLKADLGDVSPKESRFICYCIVGFDPEMIGSILGLSISNVYTKKSRLKERIRGLDSPYKEEYLRML